MMARRPFHTRRHVLLLGVGPRGFERGVPLLPCPRALRRGSSLDFVQLEKGADKRVSRHVCDYEQYEEGPFVWPLSGK